MRRGGDTATTPHLSIHMSALLLIQPQWDWVWVTVWVRVSAEHSATCLRRWRDATEVADDSTGVVSSRRSRQGGLVKEVSSKRALWSKRSRREVRQRGRRETQDAPAAGPTPRAVPSDLSSSTRPPAPCLGHPSTRRVSSFTPPSPGQPVVWKVEVALGMAPEMARG